MSRVHQVGMVLGLLLGLSATNVAAKDINLLSDSTRDVLSSYDGNTPAGRRIVEPAIGGMELGLRVANAELKIRAQPLLDCQLENIWLTNGQVIDIVRGDRKRSAENR